MTLAPGVHALPERAYHSDPCERPSLSKSIAHTLISQSPRHAWTAHPRLNPDWQPHEDEKFDVGTIAHRILLEGTEDGLHIVDAPNWTTKAAREARDSARRDGLTPLLATQAENVRAMVAAAREQLAAHQADPPLLTDGKPEQTLVWEDRGGVACRARVDWLRDDLAAVDDVKTTTRSANPAAYARVLYSVGGDIQAAMYLRGVEILTGMTPMWRWIVVETSPPYALSVITPGPDVLTIGRKKLDYALDVWRRCLERDDWPAYPPRVATAELPAWEEQQWLAREEEEAAAA